MRPLHTVVPEMRQDFRRDLLDAHREIGKRWLFPFDTEWAVNKDLFWFSSQLSRIWKNDMMFELPELCWKKWKLEYVPPHKFNLI